jgi:hypothetical protein
MEIFFSADDRGMPQSVISIGSERLCGARRAGWRKDKKGNKVCCLGNSVHEIY